MAKSHAAAAVAITVRCGFNTMASPILGAAAPNYRQSMRAARYVSRLKPFLLKNNISMREVKRGEMKPAAWAVHFCVPDVAPALARNLRHGNSVAKSQQAGLCLCVS
jgi:hypothetical protein